MGDLDLLRRCLTNFRLGVSAPHSSATPLYLHPVDGLVYFILLSPRQISRGHRPAQKIDRDNLG